MFLKNKNLKKIFIFSFYFSVIFFLFFLIYKNFSIVGEVEKVDEMRENMKRSKETVTMSKIDSDNDGLENWEENLYGTNPELEDTDGDGVSDKDEILQKRDPLIFGEGDSEKIEKVEYKRKGILSLAEQRKELDKISQRQEELDKIFIDIQNANKKDLEEKKETLRRENEEKSQIKNDLNKIAEIFIRHSPRIDDSRGILLKLSLFFIPKNKENAEKIEELNQKEDLLEIPEFKELTDDEIEDVENWILAYGDISKELNAHNISNSDLKLFISSLSQTYSNLSKSIEDILSEYKKGNRDISKINLIDKYVFYIRTELLARKNINNFLRIKEISFSDNEPGKMFVYSL